MVEQLLSAFGDKMIINPYRYASASTLLDGLVSWWSMDEESGIRVDSVTSTGNDLIVVDSVGFAAGKQSNCVDLTGGHLRILDTTACGNGGTDMSISGWLNTDNLSGLHLIMGRRIDGTQSNYEYVLDTTGTSVRFYVQTPSGFFITTWGSPLSTGIWYHIYAEYNGSTDEVGISVDNGTLQTAAVTGTPNDFGASGNLGVGGFGPAGDFETDGRIDELGFYSRILTPAERGELYNSGSGIAYPG